MTFLMDIPPEIPAWVLNPWLLVCYGWILYNIIQIIRNRKKFDTDKSGYLSWGELKFYFKVQAWGIVFSIFTIPVGVYFAPQLWDIITDMTGLAWKFTFLVYIFMGGLSAFVQWAINKAFPS